MDTIVVTGSGGLIGNEATQFYLEHGAHVIGIENNMRSYFFGNDASTEWRAKQLGGNHNNYSHQSFDIRNRKEIKRLFAEANSIDLIIHTAAQPSHDWAQQEPHTDFEINANGTLNLLEATRTHQPEAVFIYTSTNKVYGDRPNDLPLVERETRWEIDEDHQFYPHGIDESMSIDQATHSLFGASKAAGDLLVQEYGRYFDMNTACFRGGCLTGPSHAGAQLHGFLSYLMKCTATGEPYTVFGYKGKQVRDNIHSRDLVEAFDHFYREPKQAAVYNIGGGPESNCSMLEAIELCETITGNELDWDYSEDHRTGDHIWWISDIRKFKNDFPDWDISHNVPEILEEIYRENQSRWN